MAVPTNVPLMLQEAVFECIGRHMKVNYISLMQQEVKPDKLESRVAVLTDYRLLLLTTRVPGCKIDTSIHFLDILGIESRSSNKCTISLEGRKLVLNDAEEGRKDVDNIICGVAELLVSVFPGKPYDETLSSKEEPMRKGIIPNLDISPNTRIKGMMPKLKELSSKEAGPCGGYSAVYQCMCDYYGLPFMEEVAWDIDTIYLSHDTKELNLEDFDHLNSKHLVPIISALEHNQWFTGLSATNIKLTTEAFLEIVKVVKSNSTMETLKLSNNGAKWEFAQKLSLALLANSSSALTSLDLSHNLLEDRGIIHLCTHLTKHSRGLVLLNLSNTGLTARGVNRLAEALSSNKYITASLKNLDLSGNNVKAEDITSFHTFIAQPNALTHLNLSGMDCALEQLFGALKRGCCQNLSHLLLSRNVFQTRKSRQEGIVPLAWKEFANCALSLKVISLSDCKLPTESVRLLLLGLASNPIVHDLELSLSGCGLAGAGSQVLEALLPSVTTISSLDISDNGFDSDLIGLLGKLSQNKYIKKLCIGHNMNSIKQKVVPLVLEAMVQMIQEESSAIESLSLRDSKLKSDMAIILNSLGSNSTIKELDLSGNHMGDGGARMLAKALLLNSKLHTIYWDYNNTSPNGFQDIAAALQKNFTMKKMPTPIYDASSAMKMNMEKTQKALSEIEFLLQRNHSPMKFSSDQGYRLQQGFLISASQQCVDQVVVSLQDIMSSLSKAPVSSSVQKDIDQANCLIKEADASQQLLPILHDVVVKQEEDVAALDDKLKQIAGDLQKAVQHQLHKSLTDMLLTAKKQCPTILDDKAIYDEIQTSSAEKAELPKNYAKGLVCEQIGTEISNKVSELNLSIAANMSDKLIDGVIEALEKSQQTLSDHLKSTGEKSISEKSDEDKDKEFRKSLLRQREAEDSFDLDTPIPPGDTKLTTLKRKSLYTRRRPVSSIDVGEVKKTDKMSDSSVPGIDPKPLDFQTKELSKSVGTVEDDQPPPVPAPRRPKASRHSAAPSFSITKKESPPYKGKHGERSHVEPILESEDGVEETVPNKTPSLSDMLEKGSDKSEEVSLTESTDLTDGSTAGSPDSRENTSVVEVKKKPTKVSNGEAVDLPAMKPVSGLSHLAKNRPKRNKTHAARRPIAKTEAIIAEDDDEENSAAMKDFFTSKPVAKAHSVTENNQNNAVGKQNSVDKAQKKPEKKKGWSPFSDNKGLSKLFKKSPTHTAKILEPVKPILSPEKEPEPSFRRGEPARSSKENVLDKQKAAKMAEEETEKDEVDEPVRPTPRVPRMAMPGMGLGAGGGAALMAEMRRKRESVLNQKSTEDKEVPKPAGRPVPSSRPLLPTTKETTKEATETSVRPVPVTRTSSPGAGTTAQDETDGSNRSSLGLTKPRAPPRPPPKPRLVGSSAGSPSTASTGPPSTATPSTPVTSDSPTPAARTSRNLPATPHKPDAVDEKDASSNAPPKSNSPTAEIKSEDGKVIDTTSDGSNKKRLSVKERMAALLDQNRNEQPQEGGSPTSRKSSTLPRDSTSERSADPVKRALSQPGKSDRKSASPSLTRKSEPTEDQLEDSKEHPNGSTDKDQEELTVYV